MNDTQQAREIIQETTDQIDKVPTERAVGTIRELLAHCQPGGEIVDDVPVEVLDPPTDNPPRRS